MKLRTTVQLSSAIQKKPPLKREDSFLKRFSTRQIPETQVNLILIILFYQNNNIKTCSARVLPLLCFCNLYLMFNVLAVVVFVFNMKHDASQNLHVITCL